MKLLRINNTIPIQSDVDLLNESFAFEYDWTNVDSRFTNFNQSYLELSIIVNDQEDTIPEHLTSTEEDENYWGNFITPIYKNGASSQLKLWEVTPGNGVWNDSLGVTYTFNNLLFFTKQKLLKYLLDQLKQLVNIYSLIDSADIEMVYGLPDGSERAIKYHESSLFSSRARKMILLKDIPKYELEKSMYGESLYCPQNELTSFRYLVRHNNESLKIAIPLYLITGLGVDGDCLSLVKHMKILFRTAPIKSMLKNDDIIYTKKFIPSKTSGQIYDKVNEQTIWNTLNISWIDKFILKGANLYLMTYEDVTFNHDELYKTIPTYIQLDYRYDPIKRNTFNINRALPFIPEYVLFYFTEGWDINRVSNIPTPYIWPTYLSCLVGNVQMFPQTEFPTQKYYSNLLLNGCVGDTHELYHDQCPNKSLYSLWADNSNPETSLDYDHWMKHPIYIIPCKSLMNVIPKQGVELNFDCVLDAHNVKYIFKDDSTYFDELGKSSDMIVKHAGYERQVNEEINETHMYTIHMVAVRSSRDI
ncbi:hypothetical protein WA158_005805 [Blastocystis sp. Blastoise]